MLLISDIFCLPYCCMIPGSNLVFLSFITVISTPVCYWYILLTAEFTFDSEQMCRIFKSNF